ncbi:MAG: rod shape-determining protein RodA [Candidatus Magasanikbacteria bacterium]|nr:rod shape-determining protein RodA [Candidatus Magasanikbacteria bacterium]
MNWLLGKISLLKNYDCFLTIVVFILAGIGLISIYSVDLSRGENLTYFPTQIIALSIGISVYFLSGSVHQTFYQYAARFFYISAFFLLIAVLIWGVNIRGTTGWFQFAGFSFQPVEYAKVALIVFLAWWIERHGRQFDKWQFVFTSGLSAVILAGLVMLQPDLGSAVVLFSIWFLLLFLTGTKKRYLAGLISLLFLTSVMSWFFLLQDYQKDRLRIFLNPDLDPLGAGYNVSQSIIAIGAGNFFGRGLGFGSQSQLHFLPEAQTDFIFSVLAEELGFVGVIIVLILYFLLIWRLVAIAKKSNDDFGSYLAIGIACLFFIQIFFNIGGALGILPVTGITLPYLSYGGSSLIINFFLLGIAQSVFRSANK